MKEGWSAELVEDDGRGNAGEADGDDENGLVKKTGWAVEAMETMRMIEMMER